jgi:hypothetical protein
MNYLAHALPFLDRPHFAAGTAVPDWLAVADRKLRLRSRHVEAFLDDADPTVAELAAGIRQHLRDDARFHSTRAFAETSLQLTVRVRDALQGETGLRPAFLGHLLVELLLDALLAADDPQAVTTYYQTLNAVDARQVEAIVNRIAPRPTERLAWFIDLFRRERILCDYLQDDRLMLRLNQVMRRVHLERLPEEFAAVLPLARELVAAQKGPLLDGIPQL